MNGARAQLRAPWPKEVKAKLESYLLEKKPSRIAVFDWDNTVIKNDIGDATFFWMVANQKIKNPLQRGLSWKSFSPVLSDEAILGLEKACDKKALILPTKSQPACADAVLDIYMDTLPGGKKAFIENKIPDLNRPDYVFYAQIFHGYTPAQVRQFTNRALRENLARPIGAKQKIGSKEYTGYIRVYKQMKELIAALKKTGVEVWVLSASIQPTVEVAAKLVGIKPEQVIGTQLMLDQKSGKLTHQFLGCGPYADGNTELITYRQGKRCWLNKIAFKNEDAKKQMETASPISLAAGDSDTDFFFVKDASDVRIVINRGKTELMCFAYANLDQKWFITPMFIEPNGQKKEGFSCQKYGLKDQEDRIFSWDLN